MRTKEQKRTEFALEKISIFYKKISQEVPKDDANFLVGMPVIILTNGLGQSLAFLLSKKPNEKEKSDKDKHMRTFRIIKEWLTHKDEGIETLKGQKTDEKSFLEQMSRLDQGVYLKAQEETLKLLSWLKRYARAFQEQEKGKQEDSR